LRELNCEYNYINEIDFTHTPNLIKINISNNQLTKVQNLPHSLEELYCTNNKIEKLIFTEILRLQVLHCSNNKTIILENIPQSIVDFQSENNPYIEVEYEKMSRERQKRKTEELENKINYVEAINSYFKLKSNYAKINNVNRTKIFKKAETPKIGKKLIKQYLPKCILCKRPGGTIFQTKDHKHIAKCNSTDGKLCKLDIRIFNGNYDSLESLVYIFKNQMDILKERMITQKLDTLFNYISERESIQLFKKELEEFNTDTSIYKELLNQYNETFHNLNRAELIQRKQQQIYTLLEMISKIIEEYNNSNNGQRVFGESLRISTDGIQTIRNKEILKTAMEIYVNELVPEMRNLQSLKYDTVEIIPVLTKSMNKQKEESTVTITDGIITENDSYYSQWELIQRHVSIYKQDYTFGEPSDVLSFVI